MNIKREIRAKYRKIFDFCFVEPKKRTIFTHDFRECVYVCVRKNVNIIRYK